MNSNLELSKQAFLWYELNAKYNEDYERIISIDEDEDSENDLFVVVFETSKYGTTFSKFSLPYNLENKVIIEKVQPFTHWGNIRLKIWLRFKKRRK